MGSSSVVFVDTNLGTHLAMLVSDSDTVSDFKKKILVEHPSCFPNLGAISVHAVKVKCKGYFYHLADSMLVKSAFNGGKKNWFLSVDISGLTQHSERQEMLVHRSIDQPSVPGITRRPPDDPFNIAPHDQPPKAVTNFEVSSTAKAGSNRNDIEMHIADSDKQRSRENEGDGVNSSSVVFRDPSNLKSGIEHSKAENAVIVGHQSSEADVADKNVLAYVDGSKLMLTNTCTEFGADKRDGDIETASLASELLAASRAVELETSPKRRKKMKRAKNPDGEKPIALGAEHIEVMDDGNLIVPRKAAEGDKSLDGHEIGGNNLSQTGEIEAGMQAANRGPLDVHVAGMEYALQNTEKDSEDKTMKKRMKRKKSTAKSLPSVEMKDLNPDCNELLPMNAAMDEIDCEHRSHMKPVEAPSHHSGGNDKGNLPNLDTNLSPRGGEHDDKVDNSGSPATEDMIIKKKRKKSTGNSLPNVETKDPNSNGNDLLPMSATMDEINCEHSIHVKPVEAPLHQSGRNDECNLPKLVANLSPPGAEDKIIKKKRKKSTGKSLPSVEMKDPNSGINDLLLISATIDETDCEHSGHLKPVEALSHQSRGNDEGNLPKLVTYLSPPGIKDKSVKKKRKKSTGKSLPSVETKDPNPSGNNLLTRSATMDETDCEHSSHVKPVEAPPHQSGGNDEGNLPKVVTNPSPPGVAHADKADNMSPPVTEDKTVKKRRKKSTRKSLPSVEMKDLNSGSNDLLTMTATMDETDGERSSHVKPVEASLYQSGGNDEGNLPKLVTNWSPPGGEHADKVDNLSPPVAEDKIIRKKRKKSTMKSLPGVDLKDPNSGSIDLLMMSATNDEIDHEDSSHVKPVEAPSHQSGGNDEGKLPKLVTNLSPPGGEHAGEADNHVNAVHGSNEINFSDYFVPRQHEHEILAPDNSFVGEGTERDRADGKVKGKKKKKSDVNGGAPSYALEGSEDGSLAGNSMPIQYEHSESNDRQDDLKASDDKNPPVVPESKDQASQSFKSDKFNVISQEGSEKNSEASGASRSGLKGTKIVRTGKKEHSGVNRYLVAARKPSDHHSGEFVDTSGHKKSLLATSVAIFNDESSGSSGETGGVEKSDSSTGTPSDSVLSSDYSDGDSHANWNSPNDDYHPKKVAGRSILKKTYASHEKNLTLDKIMRSSSRFKKAKLVASQSLLNDTESQPVEFVPDSQANT